MAVFVKGSDATATSAQVPIQSLSVGREYVFKYHVPAISFAIFSNAQIANWLNQWFNLKKAIQQLDPSIGDPIITVTGIHVDTDTGDTYVRARVEKLPSNIQQAGVVNPYAIFATLALIFSTIGIATVFMGVYEIGSGRPAGSNAIDPCTQTGMMAKITCWTRKSALVGTGIGVGVVVTLILILFLVGRSPRA